MCAGHDGLHLIERYVTLGFNGSTNSFSCIALTTVWKKPCNALWCRQRSRCTLVPCLRPTPCARSRARSRGVHGVDELAVLGDDLHALELHG